MGRTSRTGSGSGSKNHSAAFSAMQPVTDRRLP
jgi:hypothetical protein